MVLTLRFDDPATGQAIDVQRFVGDDAPPDQLLDECEAYFLAHPELEVIRLDLAGRRHRAIRQVKTGVTHLLAEVAGRVIE